LGRLLGRLSAFRSESQLTPAQVEEKLIMGPGWVGAIEEGDIHPSLDVVASMLSIYGKTLSDLAAGATGSVPHVKRSIFARAVGDDLDIHFSYAKHDATYRLLNASPEQFTQVILTLRNGLAQLSSL